MLAVLGVFVGWWYARYQARTALPEQKACVRLGIAEGGSERLWFRSIAADSVMQGLTLRPGEIRRADSASVDNAASPHEVLEKTLAALSERSAVITSSLHDIDYYKRVHAPQDQGFATVMALGKKLSAELARTDSLRNTVESLLNGRPEFVKTVLTVDSTGDAPVRLFTEGRRLAWSHGQLSPCWHYGRSLVRLIGGGMVVGECSGDTVCTGRMTAGKSVYEGRYSCGQYYPESKTDVDGYYLGDFESCRPEGWGVALLQGKLKAGEWKAGKYRGERMTYNDSRVYGIDISRYQHGRGRRKYPIQWAKLRITSLGSKSRKQIEGPTNFPITFIYIKSTEGTTIRNPFYAADYAAAHKHIPAVGTYHFFSTKTTGARQARHFISTLRYRHGDLPPVLDLEPTKAQIRAMGGADKMWREVRVWLNAVRRRTGVRPILYINQTFVNRYLDSAPDIKRNYDVWIARYGEYKPDVRTVFWQLCPDGRVSGIRGEVDINVFNGFKEQFRKEI